MIRLLPALAVAVVLVPSANAATDVTRAAWARQANAVCAEAHAQIRAIPRPTTHAEALSALTKQIRLTAAEADSLRRLSAPASHRTQVASMVGAIDAAVRLWRQALAPLRVGDVATFTALARKASTHVHRANRLARQLGANVCAETS